VRGDGSCRIAASTSAPEDQSSIDNVIVDFPPPLTNVERLQRAAKFWTAALPIVLSYYSKDAELRVKETFTGIPLTDIEKQIIWNEQHTLGARKLADTITSLKGFYVKTAQIISSRRDLFPPEYTDALSMFTDNVDPLPVSLIQAVIEKELLVRGETFSDIFAQFDPVPLGAASVAQVHRAVLSPKYGSREVAVKVQRPSIESKLMGDIANLKTLAKTFDTNLPLDYYTVFCELEVQLADEFNFLAEAVAMERIYTTMTTDEYGMSCSSPIVLPRPVQGLVSRRVLVMDYLQGVPLSRAADEMAKRGIAMNSPEGQLFGRKLLRSLTDVFGKCILETGFFHADPHPGNIFVLDDGRIGLIDFGQVKQIGGRARETLSKVMLALDGRLSDDNPADLERIGNLALELGVELADDAPPEGPAAVAMWLFDGSVDKLPGGYDKGELSPNSPVKALKSFPQDLVLVGRSTILIKGLSDRLEVPWSLSTEWAPYARRVLEGNAGGSSSNSISANKDGSMTNKVRIKDVFKLLRRWGKDKTTRAISRLPSPIRTKVAGCVLYFQKRREARKAKKR
jgi:aarF domain-containing kinase